MKKAFLLLTIISVCCSLLYAMNDSISRINEEVERVNNLIQEDSSGFRYFLMINPDSLVEVDKNSERFRISSYKYMIYFIDDSTIVYSHASYEGADDATLHLHYFDEDKLLYYKYSSTYTNYICAEGLTEKRQFYFSQDNKLIKKSFKLMNGYGEPMDSSTCKINAPNLLHYKNTAMLLDLF